MKKSLFIVLAFAALLSSCANDEIGRPVTPEDTPVLLKISDASLSLSVSNLRADPTKTLTTATDKIGLFLSGTNYTALNNVMYTYGSPWTTTTPVYLTKSNASICAYYPYDAAITTSTLPTTILTPKVYAAASDICYQSSQTASSSASSLSFTMVRAFSRIQLTISKAASYPGTGNITSITIAATGLATQNTLNMTSGTYGTATTGGSYNDAAPAIANLTSAVTKDYLMVPSTLTSDITLTFVIDTQTLTGSISKDLLSSALASGKQYQINVNITGSSLVINSVSTTNWTAVSVTGTVTPS
jgi:hypothetical protein